MKERPILFSAPMVRALLEGRKTQTRRIVKPQPDHHWSSLPGYRIDMTPRAVGSGLAVRPTHSIPTRPFSAESPRAMDLSPWINCRYGRPGDRLWVRETWRPDSMRRGQQKAWYRADFSEDEAAMKTWRPSIFMPRWASRLTLEVTSVRVERLFACSEADALAEGITAQQGVNPRLTYANLWESINGKCSWSRNPWVWVVEFKRVTP